MRIYIVEDDLAVISILEDIIEDNGLGEVCGDSDGKPGDAAAILRTNPDVVLVDLLMPEKDGIQVVNELHSVRPELKCIMISQVSNKDLVAKAYHAGIEFYISKPINIIEVSSVLRNMEKQLMAERTLNNIRSMFMGGVAGTPAGQIPEPSAAGSGQRRDDETQAFVKHCRLILNQIGMAAEKGTADILSICEYLYRENRSAADMGITQICEQLTDKPANMEQRVRRAIASGLNNVAHLGIEDFYNEIYTRYATILFSFEDVKAEMDRIRGKRKNGGKVVIKRFIDGLMTEAGQN